MRRIASVTGVLVLGLGTVGLVFLLGMRAKNPAVLTAVRRTNRAVLNPRQMASAGSPGAYASVIQHVGRRSGRSYQTPVGAVPTEDGFVIALPYGTTSDWLKNVLSSGTATIVHAGQVYPVDRPEVVAMDAVEHCFPESERRGHRLFAVDQSLRLRLATEVA